MNLLYLMLILSPIIINGVKFEGLLWKPYWKLLPERNIENSSDLQKKTSEKIELLTEENKRLNEVAYSLRTMSSKIKKKYQSILEEIENMKLEHDDEIQTLQHYNTKQINEIKNLSSINEENTRKLNNIKNNASANEKRLLSQIESLKIDHGKKINIMESELEKAKFDNRVLEKQIESLKSELRNALERDKNVDDSLGKCAENAFSGSADKNETVLTNGSKTRIKKKSNSTTLKKRKHSTAAVSNRNI